MSLGHIYSDELLLKKYNMGQVDFKKLLEFPNFTVALPVLGTKK